MNYAIITKHNFPLVTVTGTKHKSIRLLNDYVTDFLVQEDTSLGFQHSREEKTSTAD